MENDELSINIDFKELFAKLKHNWKLILIVTFSAGFLGCLIAIGIPRKYQVVVKVAPELSLRTNSLTALSSLTGMGMSSLLSGNNDAILPSVYPDIVLSTPFIVDLLETQVGDTTLYAYMKEDMPSFWLSDVIALPMKAVHGIKSIFSKEDEMLENSGRIDGYHLSREQYAMCAMLRRNIKVDINKKNFLVTISIVFPDKEVAAILARAILDNLKTYVTEYRTQKAVNNAEYLERVTAEAHEEYMKMLKEYSEYMDRNQSILMKTNQIKGQDFKNKADLQFRLYSSLATELQQARTKVSQETPVFAEILPPSIPLKSINSRKKIALVFAFMGFVIACAYVLLKKK